MKDEYFERTCKPEKYAETDTQITGESICEQWQVNMKDVYNEKNMFNKLYSYLKLHSGR